MQDTLVLINPLAGGGLGARRAGPIRAWLAAHAPTVPCHVASDVEDSWRALRSIPQGSRVVLVGGDGTLNAVLPALLECQHSLALVPSGSGNDCARALGVSDLSWSEALAHGLASGTSPWDIGWLHHDGVQRPFASSLTVGFDSAVGHRALVGPTWLRGLPRYLLATLRELSALRTWELQVWADGVQVHAGTTLFVSTLNTPTYASGMPAVPHADPGDAYLDVLVAGAFTRVGALAMLPRLLAGKHLGHPRIHTHRYTELRIRSTSPIPLATDGEYVGECTELRSHVQVAGLQVVRKPPHD